MYNSTQNLVKMSPTNGQLKEKQMFIIRESCPSPLGEDELIDDFGCPFDSHNNLSST